MPIRFSRPRKKRKGQLFLKIPRQRMGGGRGFLLRHAGKGKARQRTDGRLAVGIIKNDIPRPVKDLHPVDLRHGGQRFCQVIRLAQRHTRQTQMHRIRPRHSCKMLHFICLSS